ncbi:MAG: hypothetical protein ACLFSQ_09990 [Candidatus Zixiibacteriota bacterium]
MRKDRLLLVLLSLVLLSGMAFGQLIRYPVTRTGTETIGTVVDASGTATAAGARDAIGVVVGREGDDLLVASSGVVDVPPTSASAGDRLTTGDGGVLVVASNPEEPLVAIAISDTRVMLMVDDNQAEYSEYDGSGWATADITNVGEALDDLNDRLGASVDAGTDDWQTLSWNSSTETWEPNSVLLVDPTTDAEDVTIATTTMDVAAHAADGAGTSSIGLATTADGSGTAGNIAINSGAALDLDATGDATLDAGGDLTAGGDNVNITGDTNVDVTATAGAFNVDAATTASIETDGDITLEGDDAGATTDNTLDINNLDVVIDDDLDYHVGTVGLSDATYDGDGDASVDVTASGAGLIGYDRDLYEEDGPDGIANDVQGIIDEIDGRIDDLEAGGGQGVYANSTSGVTVAPGASGSASSVWDAVDGAGTFEVDDGSSVVITLTANFDDRGGASGSGGYVTAQLHVGVDGSEAAVGAAQDISMVDQNYHTDANVTFTYIYENTSGSAVDLGVSLFAEHTYGAPYDDGQFVGGNVSVVKIKAN